MEDTKKLCSRDRVSELPTCIIHSILSLLDNKDIARSSTLSKTWSDIYSSYPCLVFDEHRYTRKSNLFTHRETEKKKKKDLFRKLVGDTLQRFHEQGLYVSSFRLQIDLEDDRDSALVDAWIELLINECTVTYISLCTGCTNLKFPYRLPDKLFTSRSITELKLISCYLKYSDSMIRGQCYLLTLDLNHVTIDEEAIDNLKYYCPLLESISIESCRGFTRFSINGLNRLKSLKYRWSCHGIFDRSGNLAPGCATIILDVPSLEVLDLTYTSCQCQVSTTSKSRFDKLKRLVFRCSSWGSEFVQNIISSCTCSLEHLSLLGCDTPPEMVISSPSLKTVILERAYDLSTLEFDTPKLRSFTLRGGTQLHQLFLADIASSRRNWFTELEVGRTIDDAWFKRLVTFVSTNRFHHLTLYMYDNMHISTRKPWVSPAQGPCKIDEIQVEYPFDVKLYYITGLLDALLCNFRPLHLCFRFNKCLSAPASLEVMKYLDGEMKRETKPSCCKSSLIKCWRHFLEGVAKKTDEDVQPLVWSYELLWS